LDAQLNSIGFARNNVFDETSLVGLVIYDNASEVR
jgi:hypothetical protein